MTTDFLSNPYALFDIKGKVAIVTGASGAFGALAAQVLAGAGAKVVLVAGNEKALEETAGLCRQVTADVLSIAARPTDEATCEAIVAQTVKRFGGLDILGGLREERCGEDWRDDPGAFSGRDGCQRYAILVDGSRGREANASAGTRRQSSADVFGAGKAGASGGLFGLLRFQIGG